MVHLVLPLMLAATIPFSLTLASKAGRFRKRDNHETRNWQANLSGWRQRATWAHQNAFETYPMFAAAAIVAFFAGPATTLTIALAWAYPATRIAYSMFYIVDRASLRSSMWMLSMLCIVGLFIQALIR